MTVMFADHLKARMQFSARKMCVFSTLAGPFGLKIRIFCLLIPSVCKIYMNQWSRNLFSMGNFFVNVLFVGPVAFIHSIVVFSMREEFHSPFSPSSLALLSRFTFPKLCCLFNNSKRIWYRDKINGFCSRTQNLWLYISFKQDARHAIDVSRKTTSILYEPKSQGQQPFCPDRSP